MSKIDTVIQAGRIGWRLLRPFFLRNFALPAYIDNFPSNHTKLLLGYSQYNIDIQKHYLPLYILPYCDPKDDNVGESKLTLYETIVSDKKTRLIIFGDPGSGKTTLLLKTALDIVRETHTKRLIPVFIRLRDFHKMAERKKEKESYEILLSAIIEKLKVGKYVTWNISDFQLLASRCSFVLLFDGLDELHSKDRYTIVKGIQWLSETFPSLYIVISSRKALNESYEELASFMKFWIASINPLSSESLLFLEGLPNLNASAASFVNILRQHKDLCDFLATPFFLLLAAYLFADRKENFPETKILFYKAVCDWFLYSPREGINKEIIQYWFADKPSICEKYLQMIAYDTLIADKAHRTIILKEDLFSAYDNLVSEESIQLDRDSLISHLSLRHGALRQQASQPPKSKSKIGGNTYILDCFAEEKYEFMHKSLHEFYAAKRLASLKELSADRTLLHEVEQFRQALVGEKIRSARKIKGLLDSRQTIETVKALTEYPEYSDASSIVLRFTDQDNRWMELLCSHLTADRLIAEVEDKHPNVIYNTLVGCEDQEIKLDVSLKCLAHSILKTDKNARKRFISQMIKITSESLDLNERDIHAIDDDIQEKPLEMSKIFELWRRVKHKKWMMHILRVHRTAPELPLEVLGELIVRWTNGIGNEIYQAFISGENIESFVANNKDRWPYNSKDFRGIYLGDMPLLIIDGSGFDFSYASFRGSNIPKLNASFSKFLSADFSNVTLQCVFLLDADLRNSNWKGCKVESLSMKRNKLVDLFFGGAQTNGMIIDDSLSRFIVSKYLTPSGADKGLVHYRRV